jgi:hypothetical protein
MGLIGIAQSAKRMAWIVRNTPSIPKHTGDEVSLVNRKILETFIHGHLASFAR